MKLVSWNVNGLGKRVEKGFKQVLADFDADIVCLQETKLQKNGFEYDFPGYEAYWNCAAQKGRNGTAILTKVHPCQVTCGIGVEDYNGDGRVITAEFDTFYLVCYYSRLRPVGNKTKKNKEKTIQQNEWTAYQRNMQRYVSELNRTKPVILCGDFNVACDVIDSYANKGQGCSEEERDAFSKLIVSGFVDSYRHLHVGEKGKYSWWTNRKKKGTENTYKELNQGNRLDYFLISEELKDNIQEAEIYADKVKGDHCPIGLAINIPQK